MGTGLTGLVMARSVYVFRYDKRKQGKNEAFIIPAESLDEAWRIFGHKYAVWNFGLRRDTSLQELKDEFYDRVEVFGPEEVLEFDPGLTISEEKLISLRKLISEEGLSENQALDRLDLSMFKTPGGDVLPTEEERRDPRNI